MKTSPNGIELIKRFEGLRLDAYRCPGGVLTIGYGHTKDVQAGESINEELAEIYLKQDLEEYERYVNSYVKIELTQNQFDALVSFCFNVGPGNFKRSTLLRKLNEKDYVGAVNEFERWIHSGGKVLEGLIRRRKAEQKLFIGE